MLNRLNHPGSPEVLFLSVLIRTYKVDTIIPHFTVEKTERETVNLMVNDGVGLKSGQAGFRAHV